MVDDTFLGGAGQGVGEEEQKGSPHITYRGAELGCRAWQSKPLTEGAQNIRGVKVKGGANSFELLARRVESGWMGEARAGAGAGAGAGAWWAGSLKSCSINAAGGGRRIPGR